jgi:hypothetical protein
MSHGDILSVIARTWTLHVAADGACTYVEGWRPQNYGPAGPEPVERVEVVPGDQLRGAVDRIAELERLVKVAPDYLGARSALHNHWIAEAEKAVGTLGGDLGGQ